MNSSPLSTCSFRIDVGEIAFAKYPIEYLKKKASEDVCVTFQDGRGSVRKCSGYFLLVHDRYKLDRQPWKDKFGKCKMVQFHYSVLVFIKYDVNNEDSPKYIGTYSLIKDSLYYTNEKGERVVVLNFKRKIDSGLFSPDRYEVLCADPH
ncbi:hypothetical protein ANCCAN_28185 [Ancylostoma caninum]|uniref:Uncharacterized protein n=1 Tax=Ancylostoma caninum TaxID=29170 RepID=A0A368F5D0_ANCCA|nr:hypothetical protein ANCCAN_28185 [Ancylostoma caninum]